MPLRIKEKVNGKIVRGYYDYNLLAVVIILVCFGLVMLYSASSYEASNVFKNDMYYLTRQTMISVGAIALAVVISKFNYQIFSKLSLLLYIISILLMAMVKFTSFGVDAYGSKRWLNLAGIQFQPSEIAKIAVILFVSAEIIRMGRDFYRLKGVLLITLYGGIAAFGAYYFTDNLSTAIIIMAIALIMIFIAHPKTKPFLILFAVIAALVVAAVFILSMRLETSSSFRIRRVLVWLNPEKYSELGGYQVLQGLYAIGSGGFFGKGLGNSTQKLDTIPEAQNDMIFTIICEELGLFGAIIVLLLFAYLLYRLFVIAQNAPDLRGCLITTGVFIHIALQVILNICVVLNLIPTTGVSLPFVSYGGTSVLFLMIEIGLALGVSGQIELKVKAPKPDKTAKKKGQKKVIVDKS